MMKLGLIREEIKKYNQYWAYRNAFKGNHTRAQTIKDYVKKFEPKDDNYELNDEECINFLCKIIDLKSDLDLVKNIKALFSEHPCFFELFNTFYHAGKLDVTNYCHLQAMTDEQQELLRTLLENQSIELTELELEQSNRLLQLLSLSLPDRFQKHLKFLSLELLLRDNIYNCIKKHPHSDTVTAILSTLKEHQQLQPEVIQTLLQGEYLFPIDDYLQWLSEHQVAVTTALLSQRSSREVRQLLYHLKELETLGLAQDPQFIRRIIFKEFEVNYLQMTVLKTFHDKKLSTIKRAEALLSLDKFMTFLGGWNALIKGQTTLDDNPWLIDVLLDDAHLKQFVFEKIKLLDSLNCLNQATLEHIVKAENFHRKAPLHTEVSQLLSALHTNKVSLSDEDIKSLFTISTHQFNCLKTVVSQLKKASLLTTESFAQGLARTLAKEEQVEASQVKKLSRKQAHMPRSRLVLDGKLTLFSEHREDKIYLKGGYGKIKRGYLEAEGDRPSYAVKKFDPKQDIPAEVQAKREVKYQRLLGRSAFYFNRNGTSTLVNDWLSGKDLEQYASDEITAIPIKDRLLCLATALKELDALHQKLRVHGDIKAANFILDPEKRVLKLTDFGAARKIHSQKDFMASRQYLDELIWSGYSYTSCFDVYAFGFIVAKMFPEHFKIQAPEAGPAHIVRRDGLSENFLWPAIESLVDSMMRIERPHRCTSADAYSYCEQLAQLDNIESLTKDDLQTLKAETIERKTVTEEDAFRGAIKCGA